MLCPHFLLFNHLVDSHEIQQGSHGIESDFVDDDFNPVISTIPKWRPFKLLRFIQNLRQSMWEQSYD
jgi:hypothetical protein